MPPLANGTSVYFTVLNRNKRSLALNLRAPEASGVLDLLVPRCDVVIDSFRPEDGHAARRGRRGDLAAQPASHLRVDHRIREDRPPTRSVPPTTSATRRSAGLLSLSKRRAEGAGAPHGRHRCGVSGDVADYGRALHRERTGESSTLTCPFTRPPCSGWSFRPRASSSAGADADPRQLPLRGEAARASVFQTSDGKWLALGALEAKFWTGFCERIGRADLAALPMSGRRAVAGARRSPRAHAREDTRRVAC